MIDAINLAMKVESQINRSTVVTQGNFRRPTQEASHAPNGSTTSGSNDNNNKDAPSRGSLKRLSLGKAQLEVGRACLFEGGENFLSSPREALHDWCPSFPSTAMGPPQGLDPCASFLMPSELNAKPLADIALLEEVLRFQGMLSSSRSSWGEGLLLLLLLSGCRILLLWAKIAEGQRCF